MSHAIAHRLWSSGWVQGVLLIAAWLLLWCIGILAEYAYHASIWFPPSGLTFAALLIVGLRAIPFLLIAAVISTFFSVSLYDIEISQLDTLYAGIKFGIAHIVAYGIGASVLKYIADHEEHRLPIIIIGFLVISATISLLATALVLIVLVTCGLMQSSEVPDIWLAFWVGDMVALIVLAPLFASVFLKIYPKPVFRITPLHILEKPKPIRPFIYKLAAGVAFLTLVMIMTARIETLESAFLVFFLVIPQMWLTFSESTFRTATSLAILSFLIVVWIYLLGLQEYAFVYQFAIAIIATTAYFGVAIPLLATDNEKLRQRVMSDSLTQAASRDYLIQQVQLEIQRCLRGRRVMSLLVIDIDYFKNINDNFGHAVGDQALIKLCETVKEVLRGTDVLARFGGDEFVALLPDTLLSQAQRIAERVQTQVKEIRINNEYSITTSIGIAEFRSDDDFNTLFSRADQALYRAKDAGRDRIRASA